MAKLEEIQFGAKFNHLSFCQRIEPRDSHRGWALFLCDCGKGIEERIENVKNGDKKSCSINCDFSRKDKGWDELKEKNIPKFGKIISQYKKSAKNRKLEYNLTEEQVKELIFSNCNYCGREPSNNSKGYKNNIRLIYSGIDRVDNLKGYVYDNCVSCCKQCNLSKRSYSLEEFDTWLIRAYQHRFKTVRKIG